MRKVMKKEKLKLRKRKKTREKRGKESTRKKIMKR